MKARLAFPGFMLLVSLTSVAAAGAAQAAPPPTHACFGTYASGFAQANVPSGQLVSTVASSQPGVVGEFASQKVPCT